MASMSTCVEDASSWTAALVSIERERGEGDPIATIARRGRISRYAVWSLLYRPPKRVGAEIYLALGTLYEDECARQAQRYAEERARTEAKTWIGRAMLRTADRLHREADGGLTDGR